MSRVSEKLSQLFAKLTRSSTIHEATLLVEEGNGRALIAETYGERTLGSSIVMASITKLWTTACVLQLIDQGHLTLETRISSLLKPELTEQLHLYQGQDYSNHLTVAHLLFQTSGLPDAFEEGKPSMKERLIQEDFSYTVFEEASMVRQLKPHFVPGGVERAYYADINFDLLGSVIERVTGQSLAAVFQQTIMKPLELTHSYLLTHEQRAAPPVYYKHERLIRPQFLRSAGASGGGVTTVRELMRFMRGFIGGELFPKVMFNQLTHYRSLQASFDPIYYGGGYMQIPLGDGGKTTGMSELLGHTGSTGAFAFYYPEVDAYLVGDFNQMIKSALPLLAARQIAKILGEG